MFHSSNDGVRVGRVAHAVRLFRLPTHVIGTALFVPACWPRTLRRLAVIGLPIALPVWLFAVLIFVVFAVLRDALEETQHLSDMRRRHVPGHDHYLHQAIAGAPTQIERFEAAWRREPPATNLDLAVRAQARLFLGL